MEARGAASFLGSWSGAEGPVQVNGPVVGVCLAGSVGVEGSPRAQRENPPSELALSIPEMSVQACCRFDSAVGSSGLRECVMAGAQKGLDLRLMNESVASEGLETKAPETARPASEAVGHVNCQPGPGRACCEVGEQWEQVPAPGARACAQCWPALPSYR